MPEGCGSQEVSADMEHVDPASRTPNNGGPAPTKFKVIVGRDGSLLTTVGESSFPHDPFATDWVRYPGRVRALRFRSRLRPFVRALADALISSISKE